MSRERFDAVVLGAGPAGETVASRVSGRGLRTALVELDYMIRDLDDTREIESHEKQGVRVLKGPAAFRSPREAGVDGTVLESDRIVIATGSEPMVPPRSRGSRTPTTGPIVRRPRCRRCPRA